MSDNGTLPMNLLAARTASATVRQRLTRFSGSQSGPAQGEFRIGVGALPELADHGFRDMVVLPGACYIEMALCLERALGAPAVRVIRHAAFQNPIILAADDSVIHVEMRQLGAARYEYAFYEDAGKRTVAAKLEVDRGAALAEAPAAPFSIDGFQAQAQQVSDGGEFYRALRRNGNQYGPSFQELASVWRAGTQCLGKFAARRGDANYLRPSLLDAMSQLLAGCVVERGKTFILRSLDRLDIFDGDFAGELWGHASLTAAASDGELAGSVGLFDKTGKHYLQLTGVGFAFLEDSARQEAAETPAESTCVIAANFTAEPIADSFHFWQDYLGRQSRLEFSPYNQIFQQLLDGGSALWRNRDGANVILLRLEEWAAAAAHGPSELDRERTERCLGGGLE